MGQYKEKNCPTCGTTHRKQGVYCSRSCGNSRTHTQAHRHHLSAKQSEHMNSENALDARDRATKVITLERKKQSNRADEDLQSLTLDDFMIEPQIDDMPQGQFRAGGDLWTEVD